MQHTANYNLKKPDYADNVDVQDLNDNADIIDATLAAKANLVGGKVPASELPSYVDDVIEGYYYNGVFYEDAGHTTPITGESGKIYVDLSTEYCYRWTGSIYVEISSPDSEFYWCTYDTTLDAAGIAAAYQDLTDAWDGGKVLAFYNSGLLYIATTHLSNYFYFTCFDSNGQLYRVIFVSTTGWGTVAMTTYTSKNYVDNAIAEAGQLPQGTSDGDILYWDDTLEIWKSGDITHAATFDLTPTQNSLNPVTSGGVYAVVGNVEAALAALIGGES